MCTNIILKFRFVINVLCNSDRVQRYPNNSTDIWTDMGKLEVICVAEIPEGTSVELEVLEKFEEGEDEVEKSIIQPLQDGTHKYIIDKVEGSLDAHLETKLHLERNKTNSESPKISSLRISRPAKTNSDRLEISIYDMGRQAEFFLKQIHRSSPPESRYYLNSFLNSIYAIDDVLGDKELGFETWIDQYPNTVPEQELHEYLMDIRNEGTHLGRPSDSKLRPSVGRTQIVNFGNVGNSDGPREAQIQSGTVEDQFQFEQVPEKVVEKLEKSENIPEVEPIESVIGDAQAEQNGIPVVILCDLYFSLISRWIGEVGSAAGIMDSFEEVDEVVWNTD